VIAWWNTWHDSNSAEPSDKDWTQFLNSKRTSRPLQDTKTVIDKRTLKKYKEMVLMRGTANDKISYSVKTKNENRIVAGESIRNCTSLLHGY